MKTINAENVKKFYRHMCKQHDARVIRKKDSALYMMFGWAVEMMGMRLPDSFLERRSITLGRIIYVPFTPGDSSKVSLKEQIILLCHELIHRKQWGEDKAKYVFRYLGSSSRRAHYEAEACHANLEVGNFLGYSTKSLVTSCCTMLRHYLLKRRDIRVVRRHLKIYQSIVDRGKVAEKVSKDAIEFWS